MKLSEPAIAVAIAFAASGCLVGPPREHETAREGVVRAETSQRATEVATALDDLLPQVLELLPGTRHPRLEVWVQDVPTLYAFQKSAYSDADGFFAEGKNRIHLREGSDHVERTLAHELVHAALDDSWNTLPGTLEEGLCDVASAHLVPESAARLAAGRLSSAAFATGGLVIDVDLALPASEFDGAVPSVDDVHRGLLLAGATSDATDVHWSTRLRLDGEPRVRVDPLRAFDVQAGLSTSALSSAEKRSYYGVAFLVVDRIVDRIGFDGLHDLCVGAANAGLAAIPTDVLLAAAGIEPGVGGLRAAIEESIGASELSELVKAHPEFLVTTIVRFLGPFCPLSHEAAPLDAARAPQADRSGPELDHLRVRLRLAGSNDEGLDLTTLGSLKPRIERTLCLAEIAAPGH